MLAADGLFHQQRRAAFAQGAQAQRGGFQFGVDRRGDALQASVAFQCGKKTAQVVMAHAG